MLDKRSVSGQKSSQCLQMSGNPKLYTGYTDRLNRRDFYELATQMKIQETSLETVKLIEILIRRTTDRLPCKTEIKPLN